jgi:poly(3-hydroxybutyrate) depolymerase
MTENLMELLAIQGVRTPQSELLQGEGRDEPYWSSIHSICMSELRKRWAGENGICARNDAEWLCELEFPQSGRWRSRAERE